MSARNATAARRERSAGEHVPYSAHVSPTVIRTTAGDYLQGLRLGGASFESADDDQLNTWHERLNVLWRNLATPNLALWTHLVRRPVRPQLAIEAGAGFAAGLSARYAQRLACENMMANELYVALVHRPAAGAAASLVTRVLSRWRPAAPSADISDALDACAKLAETVKASLERYEPELLGTYRHGNTWCSSLLEYLALLANGEATRVPLPAGPLNEALVTTRLLFGSEAIEYRAPAATRVGAVLGIKEYAAATVVGLYNRLLAAPFPLVLTQSFAFMSRAAAQALLQRQINRMANAGDLARSQAAQLHEALDALASGEFVMGDHHFSLQVLAEIDVHQDTDAARRLKPLNDRVAVARSYLADTGLTVAREDLALEAAFWAQLPGNFALRPRKAPLSSRNFAAMAAFHNYPLGRPHGNHWGDALALLRTGAHSPITSPCTPVIRRTRTAAAARIPDTPLSADPPARARRCSSAS